VSHFFPPINLFHHFFQPTFHPEESHAFFCLGVLNFPENRWYLRSSGHHQNRQVKVNCFYWAETVAVKKKNKTPISQFWLGFIGLNQRNWFEWRNISAIWRYSQSNIWNHQAQEHPKEIKRVVSTILCSILWWLNPSLFNGIYAQ
jgi:hypothetical protein